MIPKLKYEKLKIEQNAVKLFLIFTYGSTVGKIAETFG